MIEVTTYHFKTRLQANIMSLHNLIANGGKVLILGGYDKDWPDFREHPQLEFWSGDSAREIGAILRRHNNTLPANTKAVVISRFVSHTQMQVVMKQVRSRQLTVFPNKNTGEVKRILSEIINGVPALATTEFINKPRLSNTLTELPKPGPVVADTPVPVETKTETRTVEVPVESKAVEKPAERLIHARPGSIKALVLEYDQPELTPKNSALVIFQIARDKKITTTVNSLDQTIRQIRKEKGTFVPTRSPKAPAFSKAIEAKATPVTWKELRKDVEREVKTPADNLVRAFDDAIAALQLVRELTIKQQAETEQLRAYKERMQKRLATLLSPEENG